MIWGSVSTASCNLDRIYCMLFVEWKNGAAASGCQRCYLGHTIPHQNTYQNVNTVLKETASFSWENAKREPLEPEVDDIQEAQVNQVHVQVNAEFLLRFVL
jgi:hypothetical protein